MREPPLLTGAGALAVEARWVDMLFTSSCARAGRAITVRRRSLSRTIAHWHSCSAHHEIDLASGPLAHHPAAAHFPYCILSHSVRLRLQNQLRGSRAARPPIYRRLLLHA